MVNTKVTLSGWELDNPVIPASGTFGYGREFASLYPLDMLGTFSFKGTTVSPRFGNPHTEDRGMGCGNHQFDRASESRHGTRA